MMYDFKYKMLNEYQRTVANPMSIFKQRDIQLLQGKHDTINILAINENKGNDYQDALFDLEEEKRNIE